LAIAFFSTIRERYCFIGSFPIRWVYFVIHASVCFPIV
jgi:hypothetical protein